jgi:hypothetical protein
MLIFDKVLSRKKDRYYDVWVNVIDGKVVDWSCECKFGSWFRWAGYWRKRDTKCRHIKILMRKLKKQKIIWG